MGDGHIKVGDCVSFDGGFGTVVKIEGDLITIAVSDHHEEREIALPSKEVMLL